MKDGELFQSGTSDLAQRGRGTSLGTTGGAAFTSLGWLATVAAVGAALPADHFRVHPAPAANLLWLQHSVAAALVGRSHSFALPMRPTCL